MNCGCTKDLGCFAPCQIIDFGFINTHNGGGAAQNTWVFQIWSNGGYYENSIVFGHNDPITLPFTFNENGETMIKIKLSAGLQKSGINYATSTDGACCFIVRGVPVGCPLPTCPD
jgi:hypothetical protein